MKNKADKAIPLELVAIKRIETRPEIFLAHVMFGVEKLRRVSHSDLTEILFEKTLRLYPFAVVDKCIKYLDAERKTAVIPVWLPLTPTMQITKVQEVNEK